MTLHPLRCRWTASRPRAAAESGCCSAGRVVVRWTTGPRPQRWSAGCPSSCRRPVSPVLSCVVLSSGSLLPAAGFEQNTEKSWNCSSTPLHFVSLRTERHWTPSVSPSLGNWTHLRTSPQVWPWAPPPLHPGVCCCRCPPTDLTTTPKVGRWRRALRCHFCTHRCSQNTPLCQRNLPRCCCCYYRCCCQSRRDPRRLPTGSPTHHHSPPVPLGCLGSCSSPEIVGAARARRSGKHRSGGHNPPQMSLVESAESRLRGCVRIWVEVHWPDPLQDLRGSLAHCS